MAANDYYNSQPGQQSSSHANPYARPDAALPPLPSNHTQHSVSPVSSPFDDRPYHSSGALGGYPDTSYSSNNASSTNTAYHNRYDSPSGQPNDPFTDHNAIPLHAQPKMDSHGPDGSPNRYYNDPEQYPVPPREKRKRSPKKKGWFSGRITWVVYILTTVQIGVFVGEIIKNGILTGPDRKSVV